jgi:uncharacterized protein YegJ (DUF2314 family)
MGGLLTLAVLVGAGIVLWLGWNAYRRRKGGSDRPFMSLVFLLKAPRRMSQEHVVACASRAFGVTFDVGNPQATEFVVSAPAPPAAGEPRDVARLFVVKVEEGIFMVHDVAAPYFADVETIASTCLDMRLERAIRAHRAWIAVDLLSSLAPETTRHDAYRAIGRLLAELAGEDCLVIACPEIERFNEYAADVPEKLRGPDPLALFEGPTNAPVIRVESEDPRMAAAIAEAKQRWPEFAEDFRRSAGQESPFLVKARFADGDIVEFMWVSVTRIESETVHGTLENAPHELTNVTEGQVVAVPLSAVIDWLYVKDGEPAGGFTMKVLKQIVDERCQEAAE